MRFRLVAHAAACVLAVSALPAQTQFGPGLAKRHLPPATDVTRGVVSGDLDGDGDVDLILENRFAPELVLLNDGRSRFAVGPALDDMGSDVVRLALGDLDGDSDLDLVVAREDAQNRLYLNDGTGTFADATTGRLPVDSDQTWALALADVDADGDLDVLFGNRHRQDRLYLNDGSGVFTDATSTRMPIDTELTQCIACGDVDADGDLDIVLGQWAVPGGAPPRLYVNDGTGSFADATSTRMPPRVESTQSIALGDVDADGDLDIVLGNERGVFGDPQNRLFLNDGAGVFTDGTAGRLPAVPGFTNTVRLSDLDADGDLDLVTANFAIESTTTWRSKLYVNDGTGSFADETPSRVPIANCVLLDVAVDDFDGDGDPDLAYARIGHDLLLLNDGAARFVDATQSRVPKSPVPMRDAAAADVDGDGDIDLVLSTRTGLSALYLNDGLANFEDATATHLPDAGGDSLAASFGDVDGDGDPDLVLTRTRRPNRLHLNDGSGRFTDATSTHMPDDDDWSAAVAIGDVDGDTDLDLLVGNARGQQDRLYLNDGTGRFADVTATHLPTAAGDSFDVALGDLDGDGDLDALTVGPRARQFLENDGTGRFVDRTATHWPTAVSEAYDVELADVDGDSDLDVFVAVNESQDELFLNGGSGRLTRATATALPPDRAPSVRARFGDVDLDGDPDLVLGAGNPNTTRLYLNDGAGMFSDASSSRLPPASDPSVTGMVVADLDADGDLDLAIVGARDNRVLVNRLRHVDVPWSTFPGGAWTYEIAAEAGYASTFHVAVPIAAAARDRIPVPPFGLLGLDPTTMIQLPPVFLAPLGGIAVRDVAVPADPSLAAVTVYLQAAVVAPSRPAHLTNVVGDTIR